MKLTSQSNIIIKGVDDFDKQDSPDAFLKSGLILIALTTILSPILAILSGITGPLSAIFLIFSTFVFMVVILIKQWFFSGMSSAVVVFSTINAAIPLTSYIGNTRIELRLVDPFLLLLGVLIVVDQLPAQMGRSSRFFYLVSLFFGFWAVFAGVVTTFGGNSAAGIYYGINQIRYPLIVAVGLFAVHRFSINYVMTLLMSALSIHLIYALVESYRGYATGLTYFGDVAPIESVNMAPIIIGPFIFQAGSYPGGFFGVSRALLAVLILLFPLATYWLTLNTTPIAAYLISAGAPLMVALSRSISGLFTLLGLAIVTMLIIIFGDVRMRETTLRQWVAGTISIIFVGSIGVFYIMNSGLFANSAIRLQQYKLGIAYFMSNPVFGIGGRNFPLITTSGPLSYLGGIHNTFLAYLVETGVVGFVLYFVASGIPYILGIKYYLSKSDSNLSLLTLAVGMLGFHAYSSFTLQYHRPPVMMIYWFTAASMVAAVTVSE